METLYAKTNRIIQASGSTDGGPEGARRATAGAPSVGGQQPGPTLVPDPEVPEKKPRRKFTAKYKLKILAEADTCREPVLGRLD